MDIYIYYLVLWNCLDFLLWALLNRVKELRNYLVAFCLYQGNLLFQAVYRPLLECVRILTYQLVFRHSNLMAGLIEQKPMNPTYKPSQTLKLLVSH
ncbi:hypothetical protein SAMN05216333_11221 [Nitrosomonas oligotropha]|uniref:Uncharacterized protein n=1 Tax=Nitrosomonas oligotropha TaxID=42354 RepID=A0A1H8QLJ1_9PROT|nr:hypothetical protein SAMN05216333_11221 [Nitrosomonas oligotropha]